MARARDAVTRPLIAAVRCWRPPPPAPCGGAGVSGFGVRGLARRALIHQYRASAPSSIATSGQLKRAKKKAHMPHSSAYRARRWAGSVGSQRRPVPWPSPWPSGPPWPPGPPDGHRRPPCGAAGLPVAPLTAPGGAPARRRRRRRPPDAGAARACPACPRAAGRTGCRPGPAPLTVAVRAGVAVVLARGRVGRRRGALPQQHRLRGEREESQAAVRHQVSVFPLLITAVGPRLSITAVRRGPSLR